jgi:cell division protein FtsI (penicillin-binding protein 3)
MIDDPIEVASQLTTILSGINQQKVTEQLSSRRHFIWIQRGLTPPQVYNINQLGVPGLAFQTEQRRYYPLGALTAHIAGFTDIDGQGTNGVEHSLDEQLRMSKESIQLSVDVRLQEIVRAELQAAIDEFHATGGVGLVMDIQNGEFLALVSLPDFNPYQAGILLEQQKAKEKEGHFEQGPLFNRASLGVFEMGSTFKIFTMAIALDTSTARLSSYYDATQPIRIGRFTITDYHAQRRWLSVPEIFMYSSNIGAVHMIQAVGSQRQQAYMKRLGLLDVPSIELPEVGKPMVPHPWREVNAMTISFGHGIAVSPIQLVTAAAAVINGGLMHPPTILRHGRDSPVLSERVLSEQTSSEMRRLFRLVVERGTGRTAEVPGYLVGGKTGTAEKIHNQGYNSRALLSSFVGAFPMNDPQYIIFSMLDEPHGNQKTHGYATGGWVAAPIVGRIVAQMAPMYGIAPIDQDAPEIRAILDIDLDSHGKANHRPPTMAID